MIPTDGSGGRPLEGGSTCRSDGTAVRVSTAIACPERTTADNPATLPLA